MHFIFFFLEELQGLIDPLYRFIKFCKQNRMKCMSVFWFGLDKCQVPTKTTLSLPLLSWTAERKCGERLVGREKDRERSLTNYSHGRNKLNLGRKGKFNGAGGWGMGVVVSSPHIVSAAPSSSEGDSSHSAPAPAWGPSYGRQFSTNFSNVSPSRGLQLFMNCPSMGPFHRVQSFRNRLLQHGVPHGVTSHQTCSSVGSSLHGSSRILLEHRLPTGSQPPSGIHLLQPGVPSTGYRWRSAPPWTSMGCRGTACPTMVFIVSCKGKVSAPVSRAPPPPPSSLTLVSAELFLSYRLTPLSRLVYRCSFFPLLKYVIPEALPLSLIGLALASSGSVFELAGAGFIRHEGSFLQLLTEATPIAPLLPKPCHTNPIQSKTLI